MDLDTRMALVEQSYQQLDKRLEKVEEKLEQLSEQMQLGQHTLTKVIIGAAGTVTAGLLSTIVVVLLQMS